MHYVACVCVCLDAMVSMCIVLRVYILLVLSIVDLQMSPNSANPITRLQTVFECLCLCSV